MASAAELATSLFPNRTLGSVRHVADVYHQFSHINQWYGVYHFAVGSSENPDCAGVHPFDDGDDVDTLANVPLPDHYQGCRWMSCESLGRTAISTAMKKVFAAFTEDSASQTSKGKHGNGEIGLTAKRQVTLRSSFRTEKCSPPDGLIEEPAKKNAVKRKRN